MSFVAFTMTPFGDRGLALALVCCEGSSRSLIWCEGTCIDSVP